jgi:hypothetical protein
MRSDISFTVSSAERRRLNAINEFTVGHALRDYIEWKRMAAARSHFETGEIHRERLPQAMAQRSGDAGYASGIYSSRRLARATSERADFMMIEAGDAPDFLFRDLIDRTDLPRDTVFNSLRHTIPTPASSCRRARPWPWSTSNSATPTLQQ